jgi:hypothetical protein
MQKHLSKLARNILAGTIALAGVGVIATEQARATSAASHQQPQQPANQSDTITMTLHTFTDPGSGNMKSHQILAPKGWKVEGKAFWAPQQYFKILPSQDIKATAPDGTMVHIGPSMMFVDFRPSPHLGMQRPKPGTADGGTPVFYLPDTVEGWKDLVGRQSILLEFPNATNIVAHEPMVLKEHADLLERNFLAPMRQQIEQSNQQNRAMGLNSVGYIGGSVLAVPVSFELNGQKFEQISVFAYGFTGSDSDLGRVIWWWVEPSISYRAPAGKLMSSLPLLSTIVNSMRMTPEWQKMRSDHAMAMLKIDMKGARDRMDIFTKSQREIAAIREQTRAIQDQSQDRSHRNFIDAINEVDNFKETGTNTVVKLPMHYRYAYSNGNNEYIMTNNSLYNPNTDDSINRHRWEAMERVKNE